MGIYLNPRNVAFQKALNNNIYIDKTDLISHTNDKINKQDCFMCVSRPRRFGKSMAADMLAAYYSKGCESRDLFTGRKAEKVDSFEQHLNQHNVIRLDIQRFVETERDLSTFIQVMERSVMEELREEFPDCKGIHSDVRLKTVLEKIFGEYSMVDPKNLGQYFGFTQEEVETQCGQHGVDYEEIRKWYDGYQLEDLHIYNPKSVVDALTWKNIKSYWTGTETYEALKVYIDLNFDGLKEAVTTMLGNGRCRIDPTTFQNDMTTFKTRDDVLTLLVHLGYLTYDEKNSEVFIPNQEITQEFIRAVKTGGWDGLLEALTRSEKLLYSTWALDGEAVADGMEAIHSETSSILKYHDEHSLACAILIAYYSAKSYYLNPILELPSGKGFADVVYLPKKGMDKPALVVELKWNKSAQGAIRQIKEKQYTDWIAGYSGEILLVGLNYEKDTKTHQCVIEKYVKMVK